jgi:DNA-binding response OmpR family regulator
MWTRPKMVRSLEKIKANHYDIVLMDLKMPKRDGKSVLVEMRKLNKNPYVIVLGGDDLQVAQECVKLERRIIFRNRTTRRNPPW